MDSKKKAMVKDLQKLSGYLNFISKVVFPGRTFTRHMYAKFSEVINLDGTPKNSYQYKLKQYHHVKLDQEFKLDCKVWLEFLDGGDMQMIVNRPMVDLLGQLETSEDIRFYSDASASENLGFGAILKKKWIHADWNTQFIKMHRPSIEYLELFALCAGVMTWQNEDQLRDCRIAIFCDNMAVVHMINNMSSSCKQCMYLLRMLTLNNLRYN